MHYPFSSSLAAVAMLLYQTCQIKIYKNIDIITNE
jgi:hypothetical protein